jgi:hypothetical protein
VAAKFEQKMQRLFDADCGRSVAQTPSLGGGGGGRDGSRCQFQREEHPADRHAYRGHACACAGERSAGGECAACGSLRFGTAPHDILGVLTAAHSLLVRQVLQRIYKYTYIHIDIDIYILGMLSAAHSLLVRQVLQRSLHTHTHTHTRYSRRAQRISHTLLVGRRLRCMTSVPAWHLHLQAAGARAL